VIYSSRNVVSDARLKDKMYLDSILKYETKIMSRYFFLQMFSSTLPLSLYLQLKSLIKYKAYTMLINKLQQSQSRNSSVIFNATDNCSNLSNTTTEGRILD